MDTYYRINLYDPMGNQVALFDEFSGLNYTNKLNDVGNAQFNLPIDSRQLHRLFTTDSIVEVQRSIPAYGVDWYADYVGFHRTPQRQTTEADNRIFTSYSRSLNDLLRRCWIPYPFGSFTPFHPEIFQNGFTQKFGPADNVMKDIVRENVGPGISPQRMLYYPGINMPNFTVSGDASQAEEWKGAFAYQNVLKTLQDIGNARSVDFAVVRSAISPVQFRFDTAYPMMGVDRSTGNNKVIFSEAFGNVKTISYTRSATDEVTVTLVLGQGLEDDRSFAAGYGTNINASPYNRCELIKDARNQKDDALESEVEEILRLSAADESFVFTALQSSQWRYGRDYFLGDRVLVQYEEIERAKRLVGVSIQVDEHGVENVNLEFAEYIATPATFESIIRSLVSRIKAVEHKNDI